MDSLNIGLFFGLFFFWIIFFTFFFFWTNFWTILSGVGRPLVLREGWDVVYQYSGRGGRQTVVIEEGVGGRLLLLRKGWRTNYQNAGRDGWLLY